MNKCTVICKEHESRGQWLGYRAYGTLSLNPSKTVTMHPGRKVIRKVHDVLTDISSLAG
jgi:hypothetical protein